MVPTSADTNTNEIALNGNNMPLTSNCPNGAVVV